MHLRSIFFTLNSLQKSLLRLLIVRQFAVAFENHFVLLYLIQNLIGYREEAWFQVLCPFITKRSMRSLKLKLRS